MFCKFFCIQRLQPELHPWLWMISPDHESCLLPCKLKMLLRGWESLLFWLVIALFFFGILVVCRHLFAWVFVRRSPVFFFFLYLLFVGALLVPYQWSSHFRVHWGRSHARGYYAFFPLSTHHSMTNMKRQNSQTVNVVIHTWNSFSEWFVNLLWDTSFTMWRNAL